MNNFPGVWCCEYRHKCKWQGFALHQGLAWGSKEYALRAWRTWHDRECGGKLIQLVPTGKKPLDNTTILKTALNMAEALDEQARKYSATDMVMLDREQWEQFLCFLRQSGEEINGDVK